MDKQGNLNPRECFQAGFWDALEDKVKSTDEFGFIETDFGSVRAGFITFYIKGVEKGRKIQ
jgi:hypothetical protein